MTKLCLALLFTGILCAQTPDVIRGPIAFTGAVADSAIWTGAGGANGSIGWRLTYFVDGTGFTAARMAIQGADAPNSAGCAGASFATIATANADLVESVNPSVSAAQGNVAVKSTYPCIRMIVTAVTGAPGKITATLQGWRYLFTFPQSVSITPSGTQDVNLIQVDGTAAVNGGLAGTQGVGGSAAIGAPPTSNPVPQGLLDSAGNLITPDYCTLKAIVSDTTLATGRTKVISLSGTTTIRICKVSFTTDTMTTFQLFTGTKVTTDCDTTAVAQTAVYAGAGGGLFGVIEDYASPLITTSAKDLCVALSAGVTTHGGITIEYSQR
jgi:hypothetical protein